MTQRHSVAAIQMVSGGDVEQNLYSAERLIAEAAGAGASLIALPENFAVLDCGPLRQFAEKEGDEKTLLQGFLSAQARRHSIHLLGGTIPLISRPADSKGVVTLLDDGRVRPASLLFGPDGRQLARYDKIHLFDVEVEDQQSRYSESVSFEPGESPVLVDTPIARIGMTVCYDLRFPELYQWLTEQGAELVAVPSAFTRVTGEAHWEVLLRARAIENQLYVLAPDQGGRHNQRRETWGHSMIIDPWGTVLSRHEQGEGIAIAEIDRERLHALRGRMPVASHRRPETISQQN